MNDDNDGRDNDGELIGDDFDFDPEPGGTSAGAGKETRARSGRSSADVAQTAIVYVIAAYVTQRISQVKAAPAGSPEPPSVTSLFLEDDLQQQVKDAAGPTLIKSISSFVQNKFAQLRDAVKKNFLQGAVPNAELESAVHDWGIENGNNTRHDLLTATMNFYFVRQEYSTLVDAWKQQSKARKTKVSAQKEALQKQLDCGAQGRRISGDALPAAAGNDEAANVSFSTSGKRSRATDIVDSWKDVQISDGLTKREKIGAALKDKEKDRALALEELSFRREQFQAEVEEKRAERESRDRAQQASHLMMMQILQIMQSKQEEKK